MKTIALSGDLLANDNLVKSAQRQPWNEAVVWFSAVVMMATFSYTPTANFNGEDSFTYTVRQWRRQRKRHG